MSAKMATLGLFKIIIFCKRGYDVIISVHDVINKILSHCSRYVVDVVMWPKFGNSSISMREVVINLILQRFDQKKHFFEGWSWFKFINLGLALGKDLKFYTSVIKGLKLKFRKFWWLILTFMEVWGQKLVGDLHSHPE